MRYIRPDHYQYGKLCCVNAGRAAIFFNRTDPEIAAAWPANRAALRRRLRREHYLDTRQARTLVRRIARMRSYVELIDGFYAALYPPRHGPLTAMGAEEKITWFEKAP